MTGEKVVTLLDAAIATGVGAAFLVGEKASVVQAFLSTTTTPTATVEITGSLNGTHWVVLGTITLSGSADTDGFAVSAPWIWLRGNVTAISGISAAVTLLKGS